MSARIILILLVWIAQPACQPQPMARIQLSSDFEPATELTRLELTVTASRTPEGDRICAPSTRVLWLDPNEPSWISLPYTVRIRADGTYNRILYVRLRGYLNGMLRLQMEQMISLRGRDAELALRILSSCLGVGTGRGQSCVNGVEIQSPYAALFDGERGVASGTPCLEGE